MKKQLICGVVLGLLLITFIPFLGQSLVHAEPTSARDTYYFTFNKSFQILVPAYWYTLENDLTYLDNSQVQYIAILDQSEKQSRTTKYVIAYKGKASGVFDIPEQVTQKLLPKDMVNVYIDRLFRNEIGAKLVSNKATDINGVKTFTVETEYISTNKVRFGATNIFVFKGDTVYHLDGEYMKDISGLKEKVSSILQSFKINN